jgi:hypothetical protein
LNRKYKKLKPVERAVKHRKSDIPVRSQFNRRPIPRRRKETKKPYPTGAPQEVDAIAEVRLGSAIVGSAGALIGLSSATARAVSHMGTKALETIRETAEETRKREKKKPKGQKEAHSF